MFFWNSLAFSMIQQMLAIWSLVPLSFLNPAWTSGSSWFMYCWSLHLFTYCLCFHTNPKERQCQRMLKLLHNCTHLTRSKVILQILQARFQQYVNHELSDVQAGFRKGRGIRDQIASSTKQESSRKTSTSALFTMPKPLPVWITTNCGKFLKRW